MNDNIYCHFVSSAFAGLMAAVVGSPVDLIKTRMMHADVYYLILKKASGEGYKGIIDCIIKTFKNEGILAFYKVICYKIRVLMQMHKE